MRRFTLRFTFLFLAFFTGVAAHNYLPGLTFSTFEKTDLKPGSLPISEKEDRPKELEFDSVSPCRGPNPFEYRRKWEAEGTITLGVLNSRVLCGELPDISRTENENVSGIVTAEVLIDVTGKVLKAQVRNQSPSLQKAIVRAARQTRFEPMMLRGDAHKARGVIMYRFDGKGGVQLRILRKSAG